MPATLKRSTSYSNRRKKMFLFAFWTCIKRKQKHMILQENVYIAFDSVSFHTLWDTFSTVKIDFSSFLCISVQICNFICWDPSWSIGKARICNSSDASLPPIFLKGRNTQSLLGPLCRSHPVKISHLPHKHLHLLSSKQKGAPLCFCQMILMLKLQEQPLWKYRIVSVSLSKRDWGEKL